MIQKPANFNRPSNSPKEIKKFKDDAYSPKGKTKHTVESDWPVKEATITPAKKKIKRTETARLP